MMSSSYRFNWSLSEALFIICSVACSNWFYVNAEIFAFVKKLQTDFAHKPSFSIF